MHVRLTTKDEVPATTAAAAAAVGAVAAAAGTGGARLGSNLMVVC